MLICKMLWTYLTTSHFSLKLMVQKRTLVVILKWLCGTSTGGGGTEQMAFRMWRVVVKILNKHLWLFSKGWPSGNLRGIG